MNKLIYLILMLTLSSFKSGLCQKPFGAQKIVILGNSITIHGPDPSIGWFGNWGMAASSEENDYVHLIMKSLTDKNPHVFVKCYNISTKFERNYGDFDDNYFANIGALKPDLLIVRLGENIQSDYFKKYSLDIALEKLVKLVTQANPNAKVCITSRFWPDLIIDRSIKKTAAANHWIYVDLSRLSVDTLNQASGMFSNKGVGRHPSDLGMRRIKELIWEKIKDL